MRVHPSELLRTRRFPLSKAHCKVRGTEFPVPARARTTLNVSAILSLGPMPVMSDIECAADILLLSVETICEPHLLLQAKAAYASQTQFLMSDKISQPFVLSVIFLGFLLFPPDTVRT